MIQFPQGYSIYYEIYVAEHEGIMKKIRRKWNERKGRRMINRDSK